MITIEACNERSSCAGCTGMKDQTINVMIGRDDKFIQTVRLCEDCFDELSEKLDEFIESA